MTAKHCTHFGIQALLLCSTVGPSASAMPINPGIIVGINSKISGVLIEFGLGKHITAGPAGLYAQATAANAEVVAYGFGGRVNYYHRPYKDGWYASVIAYALSGTAALTSQDGLFSSIDGAFSANLFGIFAGYSWFWDPGVNVRLGIGPVIGGGSGSIKYESAGGESGSQPVTVSGGIGADLIVSWVFGVKQRKKSRKKQHP